jgi:hypothetical protein
MPAETENQSVATRIEDLERQINRLRKEGRDLKTVFGVLMFVLFVMLLGGFVMVEHFGFSTKGVVSATGFQIVDDTDVQRAFLGAEREGGSYLTLSDSAGRTRFDVGQTDDGVDLRLFDRHHRRVGLYLNDSGEQSLYFAERNGNTRALLGRCANGDVGFHLRGPDDRTRLSLTACDAEGSGLIVFDRSEVGRLIAGVGPDGKPLSNFSDETGEARIILGQSPEGWPALDMRASDGSTRATLYAPDEWACLGLYGNTGKSTAKIYVDEANLARSMFYDRQGDLTWAIPPQWYVSLKSMLLGADPVSEARDAP